MAEEDLRNFTLSLFKSLKSEYSWSGNTFIVTRVNPNFEKFYKSLPYKFIFNPEDKLLDGNENAELVCPGSFILHCMKEFLSDRGKTSLVKIEFELNDSEVLKNRLRVKNAEITSISKQPSFDYISRFTFLTTLKYLNEKNEIISSFYFKDKKQIEFELDKYKTSEGKKEEISKEDVKEEYELAKSQLKAKIKPQIEAISSVLGKKLEKEIERIQQYYSNQLKEDAENMLKYEKQIKDFQASLNASADREFTELRIKKISENINFLKSEKRKEELKKEEEFFIKDETNRHAINLDSKMINTTIIYFPVLLYSFYLKNSDSARMLKLTFNPLLNECSSYQCEVCTKPLGDIWLCSAGHISCYSCSRACLDCGKEYCKNCVKTTCFSCEKPLCRKCAKKCSLCGKYKCRNHMKNSTLCISCSEKQPKRFSAF